MSEHDALPQPSVGAAAVLLHWSYLRAQAIVATALAEAFPTRAEWLQAQQEPELLAALDQLAHVVDEVRALAAALDQPTLEELAEFGSQHYAPALSAVATLAERLGVDPEDLLMVVVHG